MSLFFYDIFLVFLTSLELHLQVVWLSKTWLFIVFILCACCLGQIKNILLIIILTTPTLLVMSYFSSVTSSRHRTMSDLVPSLSLLYLTCLILVRETFIEVIIPKLRCKIQSREKVAATFQR